MVLRYNRRSMVHPKKPNNLRSLAASFGRLLKKGMLSKCGGRYSNLSRLLAAVLCFQLITGIFVNVGTAQSTTAFSPENIFSPEARKQSWEAFFHRHPDAKKLQELAAKEGLSRTMYAKNDPHLDENPFFLNGQKWVTASEGNTRENYFIDGVSYRHEGDSTLLHINGFTSDLLIPERLQPAALTDEFIILSAEKDSDIFDRIRDEHGSSQGLFFLSVTDMHTAQREQMRIPIYFIPLPDGGDWRGKLGTVDMEQMSIVVLESSDRVAKISLDYDDLNMLKQGQDLNLTLAQLWAFERDPKATIEKQVEASLGRGEKQYFASFDMLPGATAGFGMFFAGQDINDPSINIYNIKPKKVSLLNRLLEKWNPLPMAQADELLVAQQSFYWALKVISTLYAVGVGLQLTKFKHFFNERNNRRDGQDAVEDARKATEAETNGKEFRIGWWKNFSRSGVGRGVSNSFFVLASTLTTVGHSYVSAAALTLQYLADRTLPNHGAAPNSLIRRSIDTYFLFAQRASQRTAVSDTTLLKGNIQGAMDTTSVAVLDILVYPWFFVKIADSMPDFLERRITDAVGSHVGLANMDPNVQNYILGNIFRNGQMVLMYGASAYPEDVRLIIYEKKRDEARQKLAAEGLNPYDPANEVKLKSVTEELVREEMLRLHLPDSQKDFLFDINVFVDGVRTMGGFNVRNQDQADIMDALLAWWKAQVKLDTKITESEIKVQIEKALADCPRLDPKNKDVQGFRSWLTYTATSWLYAHQGRDLNDLPAKPSYELKGHLKWLELSIGKAPVQDGFPHHYGLNERPGLHVPALRNLVKALEKIKSQNPEDETISKSLQLAKQVLMDCTPSIFKPKDLKKAVTRFQTKREATETLTMISIDHKRAIPIEFIPKMWIDTYGPEASLLVSNLFRNSVIGLVEGDKDILLPRDGKIQSFENKVSPEAVDAKARKYFGSYAGNDALRLVARNEAIHDAVVADEKRKVEDAYAGPKFRRFEKRQIQKIEQQAFEIFYQRFPDADSALTAEQRTAEFLKVYQELYNRKIGLHVRAELDAKVSDGISDTAEAKVKTEMEHTPGMARWFNNLKSKDYSPDYLRQIAYVYSRAWAESYTKIVYNQEALPALSPDQPGRFMKLRRVPAIMNSKGWTRTLRFAESFFSPTNHDLTIRGHLKRNIPTFEALSGGFDRNRKFFPARVLAMYPLMKYFWGLPMNLANFIFFQTLYWTIYGPVQWTQELFKMQGWKPNVGMQFLLYELIRSPATSLSALIAIPFAGDAKAILHAVGETLFMRPYDTAVDWVSSGAESLEKGCRTILGK